MNTRKVPVVNPDVDQVEEKGCRLGCPVTDTTLDSSDTLVFIESPHRVAVGSRRRLGGEA